MRGVVELASIVYDAGSTAGNHVYNAGKNAYNAKNYGFQAGKDAFTEVKSRTQLPHIDGLWL